MKFVNIDGWPVTVELMGGLSRMRGYAADPGTGPEGKTCRDCAFKRTIQSNSGRKSWVKCELASARWTNGEGTDIKASAPACKQFEPKAPA